MSETLQTHNAAAAAHAWTDAAEPPAPARTLSRTERVTASASRVVAVAAPLMLALLSLLHPEFEEAEEIPRLAATTDGWYALHAGALLAGAALVVAVLALARALRHARPLLATIGAGVTCLGAILWMALMGIELALPAIAKHEATWPVLVDFFESGSFAPFIAGFVLLPLGILLLGVAALRDRRRPRWHGALIVVGTLLTVPEVAVAYVPGFVASAVGFAAVLYRPIPAREQS